MEQNKNKKDALAHIKAQGITTLNDAIQELRAAIGNIAEDVFVAGRLYAAICDGYATGRGAVKDEIADMPNSSWDMLENIGRRQMDHRLFLGVGDATSAIKALPAESQAAAIEQPILVLKPDGTGERKPVRVLTRAEVRQVFDRGGIRSLEDQRVWIDKAKARPTRTLVPQLRPPIKNDAPISADEVSVSDGVVTIKAGIRVVCMPLAKFAMQLGPAVIADMMKEAVR